MAYEISDYEKGYRNGFTAAVQTIKERNYLTRKIDLSSGRLALTIFAAGVWVGLAICSFYFRWG